jgi:hypothetical protein
MPKHSNIAMYFVAGIAVLWVATSAVAAPDRDEFMKSCTDYKLSVERCNELYAYMLAEDYRDRVEFMKRCTMSEALCNELYADRAAWRAKLKGAERERLRDYDNPLHWLDALCKERPMRLALCLLRP